MSESLQLGDPDTGPGSVHPSYKDTLDTSVVNTSTNSWNNIVENHTSKELAEKEVKPAKTQEVIVRANQQHFREQILSLYKNKCCITDTKDVEVLEAAHIKDWSVSKNDNLNNGLCLRSDIHKLFDKDLLTLDENFLVKISPLIKDDYYNSLNGKKINLPKAQLDWPKKEFILWRLKKGDVR
jgi:putative restriction endonuclease